MKTIDLNEIEKQEEKQSQEVYTIFHKVEDYLSENYDLRFNEIALDYEISPKEKNQWKSLNTDSLWVELRKKEIKIGQNPLKAIIRSDFVPRYNPLKDYFTNLPKWEPHHKDYIEQYAGYVKLQTGESRKDFVLHLKKWLARAVRSIFEDNFYNKQAFILADKGKGQNIGKTYYLRNLIPPALKRYLAENPRFGGNDYKDTLITLTSNFLINLDELAHMNYKEVNKLKAIFSVLQINERLPYDSKKSVIKRIASFMGSTNETTFLRDETGSVRWLIFSVQHIDWSYSKEFDINNLWRQAYALYKDKNFDCTMTREDIRKNEERNSQYKVISVEQELISKFFRHPMPNDDENKIQFMTATEIGVYLKVNGLLAKNPSNVMIGKALHSLGYERKPIKDDKGNVRYGYEMIIKDDKILKFKTE